MGDFFVIMASHWGLHNLIFVKCKFCFVLNHQFGILCNGQPCLLKNFRLPNAIFTDLCLCMNEFFYYKTKLKISKNLTLQSIVSLYYLLDLVKTRPLFGFCFNSLFLPHQNHFFTLGLKLQKVFFFLNILTANVIRNYEYFENTCQQITLSSLFL